jgi:hypothetical protein
MDIRLRATEETEMSYFTGTSDADDLATDEALWAQHRSQPVKSLLVHTEDEALAWLVAHRPKVMTEANYDSLLTALRGEWWIQGVPFQQVDDVTFWNLVDRYEATQV